MTRQSVSVSLAGDSGSVYTATLEQNESGRLVLRCSCPAGVKGTLCKHLRELLEGNFTRVVETEGGYQTEFISMLRDSPMLNIAAPFMRELAEAENSQEALKKKINSLKKIFLESFQRHQCRKKREM